jgi:SAM-dependent methyltransferase
VCGLAGPILYADLPDRLFGTAGTWNLRRCAGCGLVWIDPRSLPTHVGALYGEYYTHTPDPPVTGLRRTIKHAILTSAFGYPDIGGSAWLGHALSWIAPLREMIELSVMTLDGRTRGRLLDVGCGNGQFLASMRSLGWDVHGIDIDPAGARVAREHFGLPVHLGPLEASGFPDACFDAVTLHHAIEHVPNPIGTLRECHRLLSPGGRLVVVTPNIESLAHRLLRTSWLGLDVPRHFYLFSPRTLRMAGEAAGLAIDSLRTSARNARIIWALSVAIRRDGMLPGARLDRIGPALWLSGAAFQAVEHALCLARGLGEELVMVATKRH